MITEPEEMVAICKAIDSYAMAQRAAAETGGKRWLFSDKGERKIKDDYQDPIDAGTEAFKDSLERSGYVLIPVDGNSEYGRYHDGKP